VDKVVEKPVEKIVYVDKVVEKPVEKIVYVDKVVEKVTKESLNIKDVYFEYDSAELIPLTLQTLKENANVLRENSNINLRLIGSASPEGSSDYNQRLSQRRVNAVKNFLVDQEGIEASRLNTEAGGETPMEEPAWPFVRKVTFLLAD
jgi:outer membrane protein OmpA-like peptidoglycan-associated protein